MLLLAFYLTFQLLQVSAVFTKMPWLQFALILLNLTGLEVMMMRMLMEPCRARLPLLLLSASAHTKPSCLATSPSSFWSQAFFFVVAVTVWWCDRVPWSGLFPSSWTPPHPSFHVAPCCQTVLNYGWVWITYQIWISYMENFGKQTPSLLIKNKNSWEEG